jgi:hypothetical protein
VVYVSNRAFGFWAGLVITVSILILLVVMAFWRGEANNTTTPRGRIPPGMNEDPAKQAARSGMTEASDSSIAAAQVDHVVLSGKDLQNEAISSVWVSATGDQVLEVYESGLTVLTEVPQIGSNPVEYYDAVVADSDRPSVYITDVNGVEALAVEPNTDSLGTNPGLVRFAFKDVSVVVSGKGLTVKYLTEVASKLEPLKVAA